MQNWSVIEDSIDSVIDVLNTQGFAEDLIDSPVSTHTPVISAAMAAPTFRGMSILLIVTPFFPVDLFDHTSAPASATIFETSITDVRGAFHVVEPTRLSMTIFLRVCAHI